MLLPILLGATGAAIVATVLFVGWFGPRGLASIVLGLVYLEQALRLPGESTIKLAVMATVLLIIIAHRSSVLPGIGLYARKVATLDACAPEHVEFLGAKPRS